MYAATPLTDPIAPVVETLRSQEMPQEEIRLVATSDDPELVRRHLELHGERLEESFDRQRAELLALQALLLDRAAGRRPAEVTPR